MKASWDSIFVDFLHLVQDADWFHIDWRDEEIDPYHHGVLDWLWESWMNYGDQEEDDDYEADMASYLTGIPVRVYGLSEMDTENSEMAGVYILAGLISDNISLSASTLIELGLYDALDGLTKQQLRDDLEQGDFGHLPEPLCWIADVARIVTKRTGNLILDSVYESYFDWWPDQFTWDEDIDALRAAWQEAKLIADRYLKFITWLNNEEGAVQQMVDVQIAER